MQPAEAGRPSTQKPIVDLPKERENAAARPLSVGAPEFSPGPGPQTRVTAGADSDGGTPLPTAWTQEVGWDEVMLQYRLQQSLGQWPCPVLGCCRGALIDDDDDTSVVRASEQQSAVSLDPRTAPGIVNRPMKGISVLELDVALDGRPMDGLSVLEPLEHSVLDVALDCKPMEGISVLEPLEHSVLEVILDGRPTQGISVMEPLEHSVPDVTLDRGVRSLVKIAVSDLLEHSGLNRTNDVGPGLVPLEPLEHSVLVTPREESEVSVINRILI